MRKRNLLTAFVRAEITTADPAQMLCRLNDAQIELLDVVCTSDITAEITFSNRQFKKVKTVLGLDDDQIIIKKKWGIYWNFRKITERTLFLLCLILIATLTVCLPGRILFVEVEGNQVLPAKLILEKAEDCGIHFGVSRRAVRSEKMKNALLAAIPKLEWAGINTRGCVATICVKEKKPTSENTIDFKHVSSIVALRDGVIVSCSVSKGNLLCKPGQAVKAGQTLVSGYTDCGIRIQATQAEAEIIAQTYRTLQTVSLISNNKRGACIDKETKYSLLIGKNLINFYKDSGIYDTTCAKMYEENYITLPGGFNLPIALITETWLYYETEVIACDAEEFSWTNFAADEYLLEQMVAGEILSRDTSLEILNDICLFSGKYICIEMIGQVQNEETIYKHGEYYGENR